MTESADGAGCPGLEKLFLAFCGNEILLPPGGDPLSPAASAAVPSSVSGLAWESLPKPSRPASSDAKNPQQSRSLFRHGEKKYFSALLTEDEAGDMRGAARVPVRQLISAIPQDLAAFVLKAHAYANWSIVSRYCPSCACALVDGFGFDQDGSRVCPKCGRAFFPRISPAVIVAVRRGREILLAHNAKFTPGRFGLIAGFVEPGETLEQTVRREVMEEAGIAVRKLRYVRSQPWPFPDSLMIGFEAEYQDGIARPDGREIESLGWFPADSLPGIPPPGSVARFLIDRFTRRDMKAGNS